jgi:phage-related minor tail protein
MNIMDKTIKTRAFSGKAKSASSQGNLTEEQEKTLEFAKKNARLEEENKKLLEHVKTIEELRESLKQEQAKTAEMANMAVGLEDKLKDLAGLEAKVKKVAELEARVKELTEVLGKISAIAAAGKAG